MRYIFFLLFTLFNFSAMSQETATVDKNLKAWIKHFNAQHYQELYQLYGMPYQSKVTLQSQVLDMKRIFGMTGKLKSAKFVSYKDQVYKYILYADKNQIEADVTIVIDGNDKFNYFNFDAIGGKGDPPPAAKSN